MGGTEVKSKGLLAFGGMLGVENRLDLKAIFSLLPGKAADATEPCVLVWYRELLQICTEVRPQR